MACQYPNKILTQIFQNGIDAIHVGRDGRVVEGGGLENR
jgi:hypothetical protein